VFKINERYRWERERQSAGLCWYLVRIHSRLGPVAAIVPNDPESRLLRYRADISFCGHSRRHHFESAREARQWVEQTLPDWPEWKDCEVKKLFAFSDRQRGIATNVIVAGAIAGFACVLFVAAVDKFWVPPTKAAAQAAAAPVTRVAPAPPDCRTFRPIYTGGWRSPYPPMSVWWQQSNAVVWISDSPPQRPPDGESTDSVRTRSP
jgi:hypothetical protein